MSINELVQTQSGMAPRPVIDRQAQDFANGSDATDRYTPAEKLQAQEKSQQLQLLEQLQKQFSQNALDEYAFTELRQKLELFQTPNYRLNLNETKAFYDLLLAILRAKIKQGSVIPASQFMLLSFDLLEKGHAATYEQLYFPLLTVLKEQNFSTLPYIEQCIQETTQCDSGKQLVEEVRRCKVLVPLLRMKQNLPDTVQDDTLTKGTIRQLLQSKYYPEDSLLDATELFSTLDDESLTDKRQKIEASLSKVRDSLVNSPLDDQSENKIKTIIHFIQLAGSLRFDCSSVEDKLTTYITQPNGYKVSRAEVFLSYYEVVHSSHGVNRANQILETHIAFLQTKGNRWFEANKNFIFADACIAQGNSSLFRRILIEIKKDPDSLSEPRLLFYEDLMTDSPDTTELRQKVMEKNNAIAFSSYLNTLEKIIPAAGKFGNKNILTYFQEYLGCTRDNQAQNVLFSTYIPCIYQELTDLIERDPQNIESIKFLTLINSAEGLATIYSNLLSESLEPNLQQGMFEQLAFQIHHIAPEVTRFWVQKGVIRNSYKTQPQITQELAQLLSLAKRESSLDSIVFSQEMTATITTLTEDYKVVTQGSKLQYLSTERLVSFAKQLTECTEFKVEPQEIQEGRRYAQQLGKFIKTIINNYASSTLEGCLWCISTSQIRSKGEGRELGNLMEVDWTDKKEQQCLVAAVGDIGSVSPTIYLRYRQLWFALEENSNPDFIQAQQEANFVLAQQRKNESMLRDIKEEQTERRTTAQNRLETWKLKAELIQNKLLKILEGPRSQLNHFIRTSQILRQSFYLNQPLFSDENKAKNDTTEDDILMEYIFTFFKPIGKSITKVREEVRVLKPIEKLLVQQVANAGIVFEPTEYTLQTKHVNYEVSPEDEVAFEANKQNLAQRLTYLAGDHQLALSISGRSIDSLIAVLKAPTQRSQELLVLYRQITKARETFGVWWDDNATRLRVEAFELDNIEQIRREVHLIIQYLIGVIKITHNEEADELTKVQAHVSKNVASYFAKASVGLCTADDLELYKRSDHFHCNLVELQSTEVVGNLQLYVMQQSHLNSSSTETRNALLIRGLNPSSTKINSENAKSWMDIFFAAAKKIAEQSGFSGVYVVAEGRWHEHSNRPEMTTELRSFYDTHPALKLETPFLIRSDGNTKQYVNTVYKVE